MLYVHPQLLAPLPHKVPTYPNYPFLLKETLFLYNFETLADPEIRVFSFLKLSFQIKSLLT